MVISQCYQGNFNGIQNMIDKNKMVTGIFVNYIHPDLDLTFMCRYKGEESINYEFTPGETYTIPRYVADKLKDCWMPKDLRLINVDMRGMTREQKRSILFDQSYDFIEITTTG